MNLRSYYQWQLIILNMEQINKLKTVYGKYFSLGYLNTDINTKFALISLVNYITVKLNKPNKPVDQLAVLNKINSDLKLPQEFIDGLSVVCEDFAYGCKTFPTFGIEDKKIVSTIKSILEKYVPF